MAKREEHAFLFGPFVGALDWEFYRFAPYAIYLKKLNPHIKMIVLTREDRFDLYGQYADILVPLKIKDDSELECNNFKCNSLSLSSYKTIKKLFRKSYEERFVIDHQYIPDIESFRYKLKWQFPRYNMDYNFRPRSSNIDIIKNIGLNFENLVFIDLSWINNDVIKEDIIKKLDFNFIEYDDFVSRINNNIIKNKSSLLGCIIYLLNIVQLVIGNLQSPVTKLSLLLRKNLICLNESLNADSIHLLNPFNINISLCENIEDVKGKIYELTGLEKKYEIYV